MFKLFHSKRILCVAALVLGIVAVVGFGMSPVLMAHIAPPPDIWELAHIAPPPDIWELAHIAPPPDIWEVA